MRLLRWLGSLLVVLALLVIGLYLSGAFYIVPEYKNAVVTRFGEVQEAVLTGFKISKNNRKNGDNKVKKLKEKYEKQEIKISEGAGLYFKLPFIDRVHFFESRILFWEGEVQPITTRDKRTLVVDSSARWRILDVVKFYETVGTRLIAQNRMGDQINSSIQDLISKTNLIEVVRYQDTALEQRVKKRLQTGDVEEDVQAAEIRYGRKELVKSIRSNTEQTLRDDFGVELVDVLLTQINYSQSVQESVYSRMRSERKRIAKRYIAQGEQAKQRIQGEYRRYRNEQLSGAQRRVQEILGAAESESIEIWAEAYKKDPDFFKFQRSLNAYENGLDTEAVFVLSDDNELLKFTTKTPHK